MVRGGTVKSLGYVLGSVLFSFVVGNSLNAAGGSLGDLAGRENISKLAYDRGNLHPEVSLQLAPLGSTKQNQTITFTAPSDREFGIERTTLEATASSELVVTFSVVSGPGLINPDDSLSVTGPGTVTIRASQAGNDNFNAAPDVEGSFLVTQPATRGASLLVNGNAKYVNDGTFFDGNTYNGFELAAEMAAFSSTAGEITRVSFLDSDGDLIFAEFGSDDPNTVLVIDLNEFMGEAVPSPYVQPGTVYAQGRPSFEIQNSTALTFVSFFSLGNDPTRVDLSLIDDDTLSGEVNGIAEIASLTITDGSTMIGGINAADANFIGSSGTIGIDAPDVSVASFLFVGDITPSGTAQPLLRISQASTIPEIRITGGDLAEATGALQIDTNGDVYGFPIFAADGQRSINGAPQRPDLDNGRLDPITTTFGADIDGYFVTDGLSVMFDGSGSPAPTARLLAPDEGVYLTTFHLPLPPDGRVDSARIQQADQDLGKAGFFAWCIDDWEPDLDLNSGIVFPQACVDSVIAAGKTPYIRWNPRSTTEDWTRRLVDMGAISEDFNPDQDIPDPADPPAAIADADFSMQRVIDGDFDAEIMAWADAAGAHNGPLFVELCTEVSGFQFSCNGIYNGGARTDGFGDANEPDGPERFRAAWRHIVDIFHQRGVNNVSWVFHADSIDPDDFMIELQPWNEMANYYPGDDYVDWVAISTYGAESEGDEWRFLIDLLNDNWVTWSSITENKPLYIAEMGVFRTETGPNGATLADWTTMALQTLRDPTYSRIGMITYWNEDQYRLNPTPNDPAAVAEDAFFVAQPIWSE